MKKTVFMLFTVFMVLGIFSITSTNAYVIDQNQPGHYLFMAGFLQNRFAQSFQQASNNIAGAGIFLSPLRTGSLTGDVTISLYDKLPDEGAGATLLASGTAAGTTDHWVDVFWNPVIVTPNTPYYLVFTSGVINLDFGISGAYDENYSRGQAYIDHTKDAYLFISTPGYDFAFRTYAVPIPSALCLLAPGLLGLAGLKRKYLG